MLQVTLGAVRYQPSDKDDPFLPRTLAGWDESMSEEEVYNAARGWWRLNVRRAERERFAVIVARGTVRQVIEITEWQYAPAIDRYAFGGAVLQPGQVVHDKYIGMNLPSASQNPVRYFVDQDADGPGSACRCGCGELTRGTWVHGHDHRAIHQRIGSDFGGDVARFVGWYDSAEATSTRTA